MNGACLLPSGRRFGPYFDKRCETSLVSKPFLGSVFSRCRTSSVAMACQAGTSLIVLAIAAASICPLPSGFIGPIWQLNGARISSGTFDQPDVRGGCCSTTQRCVFEWLNFDATDNANLTVSPKRSAF